jgi:NAD-dependent SIR2 family protein deacetylase
MIPYPSDVHLYLRALLQKDIIKYIVTSNQDGVFPLVGIEGDHLTEIYGNACTEECTICKTIYHRHFVVSNGTRLCEAHNCEGTLVPITEVKLYDKLDERYLKSFHEVMKSDMLLCLGAFFTKPFATFTHQLKESNEAAKIAICHSKKSFREMDDFARRGGVRFYEHVENFLKVICSRLLIVEIPKFIYEKERYIKCHQIREALQDKGIFQSFNSDGIEDIISKLHVEKKEVQSLVKGRSSIEKPPPISETHE